MACILTVPISEEYVYSETSWYPETIDSPISDSLSIFLLIPRREADGGLWKWASSVRPSVLPQHFLVRSISPKPFERLNFGQTFASVSRCAKPISQPCQLSVKVTSQGHGFEP